MNKKILTAILLLLTTAISLANSIDKNQAKKVGSNFLNFKTQISTDVGELTLAYKMSNQRQTTPYLYVFNVGDKGYVVVSGYDDVMPILGYSDEGQFINQNISPEVKKWLDHYKKQIRYVLENDISATRGIKAKWQYLLQSDSKQEQNLQETTNSQPVSPLIQTNWGQSPYVNAQCPYDNYENELTKTGCVATAMAQIMKYWSYPTKGTGFHSYNHGTYGTLSANFGSTTYDWTAMPNFVNSQNSAVATLMYHCGVSVDMNYGVDSSGADGAIKVEPALKNYFGYSSSTLEDRNNYTDSQWINLLKNELDAARPMYYEGFGNSTGHAFVLDGYDNNNFFHFNWGWSGSSDGYFNINSLNPQATGTGGGSGGYNSNHKIVRNIQPDNAPQNFNLEMYSDLSVSQSDYFFGNSITVTSEIENNGSGVFVGEFVVAVFNSEDQFLEYLSSPQTITLQSGFYATNTFTNAGGPPFIPGEYSVAVFYSTGNNSWTAVSDNTGVIFDEINFAEFDVNYSSDIETNSNFTITNNSGKLYQGQQATINVDAANFGNNTFLGDLRVNLSQLDGSFAQNVEIITEDNGLPVDYSYTNGLNFTGNITVDPGTYLLELAFKPENTSSWFYAGSSNFQNPIFVTVETEPIQPDQYENNDNSSSPYSFQPSFTNGSSIVKTVESNFHIANDNDYYKVNLPSGYEYTITARLQDSWNNNDGNTYSVDALFSYSTDSGTTWSNVYDTMPYGDIVISNAGNIIFHVAPYFSGNKGTYSLDVDINRQTLSSKEFEVTNQIKVYPNPAQDFVNIDLNAFANEVNSIKIIDLQGKLISSSKADNETSLMQIPVQNLSNGLYMLQIHSSKGVHTKKILINK